MPASTNNPEADIDDTTARESDEQDHALTHEEKLERGLEDSMDGSDAPSVTQPGDHGEPVPSSGYTEDEQD
ncbi:hypothetical protein C1T17_04160 [Sphingobium sp. SCG-1]|uniref:hypothetical protein n=1 Tax=Sphingobium sp. SCG-1 TaxID=2072936 RepID=UPI000CD6B68E|nr:hypothetical protein [Sphingobium sp. SCG-1]AUW57413.1 hypothetical protein C1T17_04160 [Sphingobium sp. SCG-1]